MLTKFISLVVWQFWCSAYNHYLFTH